MDLFPQLGHELLESGSESLRPPPHPFRQRPPAEAGSQREFQEQASCETAQGSRFGPPRPLHPAPSPEGQRLVVQKRHRGVLRGRISFNSSEGPEVSRKHLNPLFRVHGGLPVSLEAGMAG